MASVKWQIISKSRQYAVIAVSAFLLSSTTTLLAQESSRVDFSKRFYINGGVGATLVEPESPTDALTISDDQDTGGHLGLGYDLSRMLTIEAYAADLGSAKVDFLGDPAGSIDYRVFGVSLLGYLLNSRSGLVFGDEDTEGLFRREGLSLYGRVGIGHMENDSKGVEYERVHATHAAFGVGLEYGFSNGFALRSELMSMDTDAKYFNVGVLKRFGDVEVAAALPAEPAPKVAVAEMTTAPEPPLPVPASTFESLLPPNTYFDIDSSVLKTEFHEKLDIFAEAVKGKDVDIIIAGHTDWIAPEKYNMSLSVRRAEAIVNYLTSKGVEAESMTTMGYGETRPISNNNTANGRALNRRAEVHLR